MHADRKSDRVAIGFRVKSGFAVAVLVSGPASSPRALDRRQVALSDPDFPETRQPYHAATGVAETGSGKLQRRIQIVQRYARRSISALILEYRSAGHELCGAGLVVGSDVDPERIANPHIRAHAAEGRLFRTVLEDGAHRAGLATSVVRERDLYASASRRLRKSEEEVKRAATELGRAFTGQWRAEEKTAAISAWLILAGRPLRKAPSRPKARVALRRVLAILLACVAAFASAGYATQPLGRPASLEDGWCTSRRIACSPSTFWGSSPALIAVRDRSGNVLFFT